MTDVSRSVLLRFDPDADDAAGEVRLRAQISALVQAEGHLWVASDESNSVERFSRTEPGVYAQHRTFRLADYLALLGSEDDEHSWHRYPDFSPRIKRPTIRALRPIATLSYGPAYVDEVGILCDLNARYLGMTPLALAERLVGDLERRGAYARERHDRAAHRRVREMFG